jgi:hypothetical protein
MEFINFLLSLLKEFGPAVVTAFIAWLIRKFEKPKAVKAARQSAFDEFISERPDLIEAVNKHLVNKEKQAAKKRK